MNTRNQSVTQFDLASSLASIMKLGDTIIPRNREYVMVYDYFYRLQEDTIKYHERPLQLEKPKSE